MNDKPYTYLKDRAYYSELYDKLTIEKCQDWENKKYYKDVSKLKGREKEIEEAKERWFHNAVIPLALYFIKAERASKKSETIQEWMKRDKEKDEKVINAKEPQGVRCLDCSSSLKNCISRDLMNNHKGKEEVLFMFECSKCGKRRAFWEDGTEWEHRPKCAECRSEVKTETKRRGNIINHIYSCPNCGHVETDKLDLSKKEDKKIDQNFEANRKKYCISEQEGYEIISRAEQMRKLVEKFKDKEENKDIYDAVGKIKKLNIAELQDLLDPVIENNGYAKLEFEKPEIQRDVILGFSLQDNKSGREKYDSVHNLQKLIKETLVPTNWRLMSDGITYRLGFLQGRLKGVEGEENLLKLAENDLKKKAKRVDKLLVTSS